MTGSTTCDPQQIDEYKRVEEEQMLAYQRAITNKIRIIGTIYERV